MQSAGPRRRSSAQTSAQEYLLIRPGLWRRGVFYALGLLSVPLIFGGVFVASLFDAPNAEAPPLVVGTAISLWVGFGAVLPWRFGFFDSLALTPHGIEMHRIPNDAWSYDDKTLYRLGRWSERPQ